MSQITGKQKKLRNIEYVIEATLQGQGQQDIADTLKVSTRTIQRYLNDGKLQLSSKFKSEPSELLMGSLNHAMTMRLRQLWKMLNKEDLSPKDRIAAINSLREEDRDLTKRAQIVGLLPIPNSVPNGIHSFTQVNVINQKMSQEEAIYRFLVREGHIDATRNIPMSQALQEYQENRKELI